MRCIPKRPRLVLVAVAIVGITMFAFGWPRGGVLDPRLIGGWDVAENGFLPLQFNPDGSAEEIDVYCGGRYSRYFGWSIEGPDLQLEYAAAPRQFGGIPGFPVMLRRYWFLLWNGASHGPRYRILELTPTTLRLQRLLADGSVEARPVDVYRKTKPGESPQGL